MVPWRAVAGLIFIIYREVEVEAESVQAGGADLGVMENSSTDRTVAFPIHSP